MLIRNNPASAGARVLNPGMNLAKTSDPHAMPGKEILCAS